MKTFSTQHARQALLGLGLLGALACQANVQHDNQPDLLFVLWDPTADVAFTLDLGLNANDFWLYAQQDSGYSLQYTLPAADARLAAFRAASTTAANQRWAVFAVQSNADDTAPGANKLFSTLRQGPGGGVTNPNWLDLTNIASADFVNATKRAGSRWLRDLNSFAGNEDPAMNTHVANANGSAFHRATSPRYFGNNSIFYEKLNPGAEGGAYSGFFDVTNAVNQSSWFYYVTNSASQAVTVDEFDNLSSNGYWGLALTSTNTYSLTFTQVATQSGANSADTEVGRQRMLTTDYAATTGAARWLGNAEPAMSSSLSNVSAVPEPSTWGLMGLGLLLLAGRARRHSSRA